MQLVRRGLLVVVLAMVAIIGPSGCGKEEPSNPNLKVPEVPPAGKDSKKLPTKK